MLVRGFMIYFFILYTKICNAKIDRHKRDKLITFILIHSSTHVECIFDTVPGC
jgi:hypothetical protein